MYKDLSSIQYVGALASSAGFTYLNAGYNNNEWLDNKDIIVQSFPVMFTTDFTANVVRVPETLLTNYPPLLSAIETARLKSWNLVVLKGDIQIAVTNPANSSTDAVLTCRFINTLPYKDGSLFNISTFATTSPNSAGSSLSGYACDGPVVFTQISAIGLPNSKFDLNFVGELLIYQSRRN